MFSLGAGRLLLIAAAAALETAGTPCATSDATLRLRRETFCASVVDPLTPWCQYPGNVSAHGDWPNQAVYMHKLLKAVASAGTCLNTSYAADTAHWLNMSQASSAIPGTFMNTIGFQSYLRRDSDTGQPLPSL